MNQHDLAKYLDFIDIDNPTDVALAQHYINFFASKGFPPEKIDTAFRWAQQNVGKMGGDVERMTASFTEFATADGWQPEHISGTIEWHQGVADRGLPDTPAAAAVARSDVARDTFAVERLAEISRLRTDDPDYFQTKRAALEAEELALLSGEPRPPTTRMDEIRWFRKNDPDYFESNRAKLEAEELNLIEASLPAPNAEPAAQIATAQPQGGSDGAT